MTSLRDPLVRPSSGLGASPGPGTETGSGAGTLIAPDRERPGRTRRQKPADRRHSARSPRHGDGSDPIRPPRTPLRFPATVAGLSWFDCLLLAAVGLVVLVVVSGVKLHVENLAGE